MQGQIIFSTHSYRYSYLEFDGHEFLAKKSLSYTNGTTLQEQAQHTQTIL